MAKKKLDFFKSIEKMITEIPISDIMTSDPITLLEDDPTEKAIALMAERRISSILVVDKNGHPVGLVSDGDMIRKVISKGLSVKEIPLKQIMSRNLKTIEPDTSIGEASLQMKKLGVSKFPIMDNKKLVGYVTKSDIIKKLNDIYYQNSQLKWLPILLMTQFIIIAILIVLYLKK